MPEPTQDQDILSGLSESDKQLLLTPEQREQERIEKLIQEEQVEVALDKMRDIRAFGTISHGQKNGISDYTSMPEIIKQGLSPRSALRSRQIEYRGVDEHTIYPKHVSYSMNTIDGEERNSSAFSTFYLIDPDFINDILLKDNSFWETVKDKNPAFDEAIRFVGDWFKWDGKDKFLSFAEKSGWIDSVRVSIKNSIKYAIDRGATTDDPDIQKLIKIEASFDSEAFASLYLKEPEERGWESRHGLYKWDNEVIISGDASIGSPRSPINGIISASEWSTDRTQDQYTKISSVVSEAVGDEVYRTIPIYDLKGNMVWPVRMERPQIIETINRRQLTSEQTDIISSLRESLASFVFENTLRPMAIERSLAMYGNETDKENVINNTTGVTWDAAYRRANGGSRSVRLIGIGYSELPSDWKADCDFIAETCLKTIFEQENLYGSNQQNLPDLCVRILQHRLAAYSHVVDGVREVNPFQGAFVKLPASYQEMRMQVVVKALELIGQTQDPAQNTLVA